MLAAVRVVGDRVAEAEAPTPPSIRSNGCTTWAWWPSTRSMSGEASSARTAASWAAVGSWSYSRQQCRLATTTSAPAARARAAAASIRVDVRHVRHVHRPLEAGRRAPAVEGVGRGDVPDPHAPASTTVAPRCRPADRYVPLCAIPAASRVSRVRAARPRRRPGSGWTRSSRGRSRRRPAPRRSRAGRRSSGTRGRGRPAARPASRGGRSRGRRPRSAGRRGRGRRRSRSCRRPGAPPR